MKNRIVTMQLPEGNFATTVTAFDESDVTAINAIYDSWRDLCVYLGVTDARAVNLPEDLCEISFSIAENVWRCSKKIPGANSYTDCYDPNADRNNNRIEVNL